MQDMTFAYLQVDPLCPPAQYLLGTYLGSFYGLLETITKVNGLKINTELWFFITVPQY